MNSNEWFDQRDAHVKEEIGPPGRQRKRETWEPPEWMTRLTLQHSQIEEKKAEQQNKKVEGSRKVSNWFTNVCAGPVTCQLKKQMVRL
eukprot:5151893-Amphidinium_carterae.1